MYIPIMKNRQEELNVSKRCEPFFSDELIPLFEILKDDYISRPKLDEEGNVVYEIKPGKKKRSKVMDEKRDEDCCTLDNINSIVNGKKVFIDFFRFFEKEYGNKKFKNIELSFKMSRDFRYYIDRILEIKKFENFIPVISIKKGLIISESDLFNIVQEFQKLNRPLAIRITDDMLEDYEEFMEEYLTKQDFIMLDIREKDINSKKIELMEFKNLDVKGKKILLNSPRKKSIKNSEFENLEFTNLIDNSAKRIYKKYGLDGFGDFGGLKDDLPTYGGNGKGAALSLLYFGDKNKFFAIVNTDTSLGVRGYQYVKEELNKLRSYIDPKGNCVGIEKAYSFPKGGFKEWNNVNLSRYIQQQSYN